MAQQQYGVWIVRFNMSMPDPDMPSPRYHTTVFVETQPGGDGTVHHVTGNITSAKAMSYERRRQNRPEDDSTFHSKEYLGYANASTYPASWDTLLSSIPAPPKQKEFNMATMKTEPFKSLSPLTFYKPGEPRRPLVKCTEWTLNEAIPALKAAGLII